MTTTKQSIPAITSKMALRSLRDSGFSLGAALGESVDNSIEANANHIRIRLDEGRDRHGKKRIHRVVIIDDGEGMDEDVLHHYPQLGFSTRYMRTDTIGKYGVGAKLAALNFATRLDAWSRTASGAPWLHVYLDIGRPGEETETSDTLNIEPPDREPVPADLLSLMPTGSGTLVVWSEVDRLEEGRLAADANALRVEVEKELSRMFRYFLHDGIEIRVNDTTLLPHDPLFLMDRTWADQVLTAEITRGAGVARGDDLQHFPARMIANEKIKVAGSTATLRVTLYPKEVTRRRGQGGDTLALKLRVPENEGVISFVRLNREINYTNVPRIFPRGVENPDRFIGIEVAFTPELDDFFGVRNVKRGVEPHDELRAEIRKLLGKYIPVARDALDEMWGAAAQQARQHQGEHNAITEAAKEANRTLPKSRATGPEDKSEEERIWDDLAHDVEPNADEAERERYKERVKDLPFVVESVDFPGTNFLDIQHVNGQVIIRLNTRHRFYREMWEPIRSIALATPGSVSADEAVRVSRRTLEALSLLVIAYGKAESMHERPHDAYLDLRTYWGQFLDSLLGKVKDVL